MELLHLSKNWLPVSVHYRSLQVSSQYQSVARGSDSQMPPHVFAIAGNAYKNMLHNRRHQVNKICDLQKIDSSYTRSAVLCQERVEQGRLKRPIYWYSSS